MASHLTVNSLVGPLQVGRLLITALERWAVSSGFGQIFLTTWTGPPPHPPHAHAHTHTRAALLQLVQLVQVVPCLACC